MAWGMNGSCSALSAPLAGPAGLLVILPRPEAASSLFESFLALKPHRVYYKGKAPLPGHGLPSLQ